MGGSHPVPDDERIEREREQGERRARRTIGKCREVSITGSDFCLFTSVCRSGVWPFISAAGTC